MRSIEIPLRDDVFLRNVKATDAQGFFDGIHAAMPDLAYWEDWAPQTYSLMQSRQFCHSQQEAWGANREFTALMIYKPTGRVLGGFAVNQIRRDYRLANVGYWIVNDFRGQGLSTAAVKAMAKFAFEQLHLMRLEMVMRTDNLASRRVAEKAGGHFEGVARNRLYYEAQPLEAAMYSLIP